MSAGAQGRVRWPGLGRESRPARVAGLLAGLPRWLPDLVAVIALFLVTTLAMWDLIVGGTMLGQDAAVYFYPIYEALGERLRAGDVPGWNPAQFGGAPFAGNPQSGWMYLPAMLLFTLLPVESAANAFMFLHLFGAGLGTYGLARVLRLGVPGALVAAMAYAFTGFLYERTVCCFAYGGIALWLPLMLLSAEMGLRSRDRLRMGLWWALGGVALSQALAAWLGQGAYYALLALGGYMAYRTLLSPPAHMESIRSKILALALHGTALLAFGFGFAAAGVIPRLEYNAFSSLSGGYTGTQAAVHSGWSLEQWASLLWRRNWYGGGVTLLLALIAPVVARGRHATPYFATLCVAALILSGQGPTPLHTVLYWLPGFARLHPHDPERVLTVFYLGSALLAGATVQRLGDWGRRAIVFVPPLAFVLFLLPAVGAALPSGYIPATTLLSMLAAVVLLCVWPLVPRHGRWVGALLAFVLVVDLLAAGREVIAQGPGGFRKVQLDTYYAPGGAAKYLLSRPDAERYRYFGYDPSIRLRNMPYRWQWASPEPAVLLVNNRATLFGLQDVQGYDPVHTARYDEYMQALNGKSQEYRGSYVLDTGLGSPLLNALNARYVVVPRVSPPDRKDLLRLESAWKEVYRDDLVRILENPQTLPRAWVVHEARRVQRGEALELLASRRVNPRSTVLIESDPPSLAQSPDPAADRATIRSYEPDRIRLSVRTDAPGMLVLSEVYFPAWKAYVDGKSTEVYPANHALRAVRVPAGEHTVEFRYESWSLQLGIAITIATLAIASGLVTAALLRWRGMRRPARREGTGSQA